MADEITNLSKRFDNLLNTFSHPTSATSKFDMPSYNPQLPPTPPECWPHYGNGVPHYMGSEFRPLEKDYRGFNNGGAYQFETTPFETRQDSHFAARQQANYHGVPAPPGITHPNHWFGSLVQAPQKRVELPPIDGAFDRQMYQVSNINSLFSNIFVSDQKQQSHMHQRRQQRQERKQEQAARPAEEKPVGGVSAHLDYDMEEMTGFVGQVSQHLYVGHFQTFSFEYFTNSPLSVNHPLSIEAQERGLTRDTRKFVLQILSSTRLPSSTILLGLVYLKERVSMPNFAAAPRDPLFFHRMLTIALLLASKFLDDNTFQNKSWSEVTGLAVAELNALEKTWLEEIGWHLHVDPEGTKGFSQYKLMWDAYRKNGSKAPAPALAPINTNIRRQHRNTPSIVSPDSQMWANTPEYPMSGRKSYELMTPGEMYPETAYYSHHSDVGSEYIPIQLPPPQPQHRQYENGGYWAHMESRMEYSAEYSPPSAPETGPPTPVEYAHAWPGSAGFPPSLLNPPHQSATYSRLPPPIPSYHQHMGQTWRPPFCGYAYGQRTENYLMTSFGQPVTA